MACLLVPETEKTMDKLARSDLRTRLIHAYIPSLPPKSDEAGVSLVRYCVIVGILLRACVVHTKGQQYWSGLGKVVDEALQRREERLKEIGDADEIEEVIREAKMMRIFADKAESR
jgi:hypothetical protein